MRIHVVWTLLIGTCWLAYAAEPKGRATEGKIEGNHGNIAWVSRAKPIQGKDETWWVYECSVTNRSPVKRCRVIWDLFGFREFIEPEKTFEHPALTTSLPPRLRTGVIRLNGGSAAGYGIVNAQAWLPDDSEAPKFPATAKIEGKVAFTTAKGGVTVKLLATSDVRRNAEGVFEYAYLLNVEPEQGPTPADLLIRWDSATSPEFLEAAQKQKLLVPEQLDGNTKQEFFRWDGGVKGAISFKTSRPPVFRHETLRFLEKPGAIETEVSVPCWAPPPLKDE